MKIFDITIPLSDQTPVWEGDKEVSITRESLISQGADFNVSHLSLGAHVGTHIDAPYHAFTQGDTIDRIPLEKLVGRVQVVEMDQDVDLISADVLAQCPIEEGITRVLFKTRNSLYWKKEPYHFSEDYVGLDVSAAAFLAARGIQFVGIDWFSISPMQNLVKPHEILFEAGIVVLENANLLDIEPGLYDLYCLPLKLVGTDGAPARVILTRPD
jgi:arylformamidase